MTDSNINIAIVEGLGYITPPQTSNISSMVHKHVDLYSLSPYETIMVSVK